VTVESSVSQRILTLADGRISESATGLVVKYLIFDLRCRLRWARFAASSETARTVDMKP